MGQWSEKAKRKAANRGVPYDLLDEAVEKAKELFPGADKYVPVWCGGVYVEVWKHGRADVHQIFGPARR